MIIKTDLIVLARYMQILTAKICRPYHGKILNIHPSLLPYFPGANAYKQALDAGLRVCGCTAHFVTEKLDEGPRLFIRMFFHINIGEDTIENGP